MVRFRRTLCDRSAVDQPNTDVIQGTLDMLILRTLSIEPLHGYAIAQRINQRSRALLSVPQGSLYPALQRLLLNDWVKATWGASENNRRARYYTITAAGRKRLAAERQEFDALVLAIQKVLNARPGKIRSHRLAPRNTRTAAWRVRTPRVTSLRRSNKITLAFLHKLSDNTLTAASCGSDRRTKKC